MKILCNCTTLNKGGAMQASISFIEQAVEDRDIDWIFAISRPIADQLAERSFFDSQRFIVFENSPAKYFLSRKKLLRLEMETNPHAVFTFFGPAYVKFKSRHFLGFANPWITHPNTHALSTRRSFSQKCVGALSFIYKKKWLSRADYWIVEADVAKLGIIKLLGANPSNIAVVKNSCRDDFWLAKPKQELRKDSFIKILYITAYYKHKNLEIIPEVAHKLNKIAPDLRFEFITTLPENIQEYKDIKRKAVNLGVENRLKNIGPVKVKDVPKLYSDCHIAFVPTLLETFSASYPEAMASGLPIVCSDFDFARGVCKDAASYFNPESPQEAAEKIAQIIFEPNLQSRMIEKGKKLAGDLPSAHEKYHGYKGFITRNTLAGSTN